MRTRRPLVLLRSIKLISSSSSFSSCGSCRLNYSKNSIYDSYFLTLTFFDSASDLSKLTHTQLELLEEKYKQAHLLITNCVPRWIVRFFEPTKRTHWMSIVRLFLYPWLIFQLLPLYSNSSFLPFHLFQVQTWTDHHERFHNVSTATTTQ